MLTKLAHVIGPALVGIGVMISDDPKFMLITLIPLFLLGGAMLARVREESPQ
jgi:MFS-type transporter involved in bile tolerance (Atg22 family)